MTLDADTRHSLVNYTSGKLSPKERAIRAREFISRNRIVEDADRREVALLAAVRMEDIK